MAEAAILDRLPRVAEVAVPAAGLADRLTGATTPFVVRGLAADWPLVQAAGQGGAAVRALLARQARPRGFPASIASQAGDARLFYTDAMAMNFRMDMAPLAQWLAAMAEAETDPAQPTLYLSSIDMADYFTGLGEAHQLPLGDRQPLASIWIGTRTCIAAHNDVPENVAVCAAGRRRFTLFPPDQFANLYVGPLDNTPAGRPVSLVDVRAPYLARFPRFAEALAQAQVAELGPGDAIFVRSLWWHHVEGLAPFNVLVNFWWRDCPRWLGNPEDALLHAILAVRDLPDHQRRQWQALFDHHVFAPDAGVTEHLPPEARGVLAPLTPETAGRIKARLLRGLSR
ncbi:cupin [Sandarakinorhabdus cyanobacteriorum]|uniref:Cupin n=1 Tax=Sandarakinorhabdus cyanobacteriorum TaxID=1981098 RepID=A0A255YDC1_9SPHN|nr:cupin-like domain-containing protein [Sandarakinorhabdus cyanobacteriorum]OYQ27191.1 cupin [Sandarakinorhabdus cyanobacteriorum]